MLTACSRRSSDSVTRACWLHRLGCTVMSMISAAPVCLFTQQCSCLRTQRGPSNQLLCRYNRQGRKAKNRRSRDSYSNRAYTRTQTARNTGTHNLPLHLTPATIRTNNLSTLEPTNGCARLCNCLRDAASLVNLSLSPDSLSPSGKRTGGISHSVLARCSSYTGSGTRRFPAAF